LRHKRDGEDPAEKVPSRQRWPLWWPSIASVCALAILGGIIWLRMDHGDDPAKDNKPPAGPKDVAETKDKAPDDKKAKPAHVEIVAPHEASYPGLFDHSDVDWCAWSKKVYGPFAAFPASDPKAPVVQVSRLPGLGQYATIAEALAQYPDGPVTIEIHDNGP